MNELQANRAILKAACMRAIFNSDGSISDVRRSVLVQLQIPRAEGSRGSMTLYSSADFDALPNLTETSARLPIGSVIEVWDGRLLSTRRNNAADGYYRLETADVNCCDGEAHHIVCPGEPSCLWVPTQTEEPITCPTCGELGYDDPAECSFCEDQKYINTQTERLF